MSFVVRRSLPVFTVSRSTIFDGSLSPTTRLLHVVLLASRDGDLDEAHIEQLAGVAPGELGSYVAELESAKLVTVERDVDGEPTLIVHVEPEDW